jgi:hypothetical protein
MYRLNGGMEVTGAGMKKRNISGNHKLNIL